MTVRLHQRAYGHAKQLIAKGEVVTDERKEWSKHQPSAAQENEYIKAHGLSEYGRWYLGIDDRYHSDTKEYYKFPYSDLQQVHRCGVLSAEVRAAQYKHHDIEQAVAHLHGMIDGKKGK